MWKSVAAVLVLLIFVVVIICTMPSAGKEEWNNNPEVFQVNREVAHANFIPFGDVETALKQDPKDSPYYLLLMVSGPSIGRKTLGQDRRIFTKRTMTLASGKRSRSPVAGN